MDDLRNSIDLARLSIQRALLGEVSSRLRAVVFSLSERALNASFYFDGPITPDDAESASRVETEIIADCASDFIVAVNTIRLDAPEPVNDDGVWVYQCRESTYD